MTIRLGLHLSYLLKLRSDPHQMDHQREIQPDLQVDQPARL